MTYKSYGNNIILKHLTICFIILLLVCVNIPADMNVSAAAKPKLAKKNLLMYVGGSYRFKTKGCRWKSSKKKIASVNSKGTVKAKRPGTTRITAISKKNGKKAVCNVKVGRYIKSIVLNSASTVILKIGQTSQIRLTVSPSDVLYKDVIYSSDNSDIASVDKKGVITSVAEGTTQIKAVSVAVNSKKKTITKKITVVVIKAADDNIDTNSTMLPEDKASLIDSQNNYDRIITPVTPAATPAASSVPTSEPVASSSPAATPVTSAETTAEPTAEPTIEPTVRPLTVKEYVDGLNPSADELVAGQIVVADSAGAYRTLYFINKNYSGNMNLNIDGYIYSKGSSAASLLHDLVVETGAVTNSAETVRVSRRKRTSSWTVEMLKTGVVYYISGMETDTLYGSPYGIIIAEGDTTSRIKIY